MYACVKNRPTFKYMDIKGPNNDEMKMTQKESENIE